MSKLRLLRLSGNQEIRVVDIRRIGKLELRMDSASKPALSKTEWVRNDRAELKRYEPRPSSAVPKWTPCGGCLAAKTGRGE